MSLKSIWDVMCGRNSLNESASLERCAASLELFLKDKDSYTALCAGTMNSVKFEKTMTKVIELLKEKNLDAGIGEGHKYSFLLGGDVLKEAKCVELCSKVNGVIVVEEAYESTFSKIDEELNAFKELGVEVAGFVLVHN